MTTQETVREEIAALQNMSVNELLNKHIEVFQEKSRARNKPYLIKRIAWRIQANAYGGISARAKRRARQLANESDLRVRYPSNLFDRIETVPDQAQVKRISLRAKRDKRLPVPGSIIEREYQGKVIEVEVETDSFRWNDTSYKSLSAIAKAATGKSWNGFTFFQLND